MAEAPLSRTHQFAEYLAQGLSVDAAGRKLGVSYAYANAIMQRIRKSLGAQAI
jgi:molybdenum-dependent DNA-binding transcriptional regulator ModE